MYIELDIPEVPELGDISANYFLTYMLKGSPSTHRDVNALASTLIRLVEVACIEYRLGAASLELYFANHSSPTLQLMNRCVSHFENCISATHRSIRTYRALRNHRSDDDLSLQLRGNKAKFNNDAMADQIKALRDTIHHLDEKLYKGDIGTL